MDTTQNTPETDPLFTLTGPAWLLEAAARLEAEGQHELAAEARVEAQAAGEPAPSAPAVAMRCEDCGRSVGISRMPADWSLDWWSHRLNGRPCQ